jgi:hypothetical protein
MWENDDNPSVIFASEAGATDSGAVGKVISLIHCPTL